MTEQYKLKQGDMVVMHTCMEHDNPDNFGKIWTCKSDQFTRGTGVYNQDSVFLEGFSGSFSAEFLQKVDMAEAQQTIADKDAAIKELETEHAYAKRMAVEWNDKAVSYKSESDGLRKALDYVQSHLVYGGVDEALECISKALGEEVES